MKFNNEKGREVSVSLMRRAEENLSEGRINSFYRYRSTLRAFEKCAGRPIAIDDISPTWLEECEKSFRARSLSYTTINIYMKALKAAVGDVIMQQSPCFGKGAYEIPNSSQRRIALTKEQVRRIAEYAGTPIEEKYRDLWLFSYLCNGINFRDLIFLKYSDIENGEICFVRTKTKRKNAAPRMIRAVITPDMKRIMARLGNGTSGSPDSYIFPFARAGMTPMEISNLVRNMTHLCNRSLHRISAKTGLPHFTTYSARHSFATVLQRSGVTIDYISECLGHSNLEVTRVYLAGFDKATRIKYARKLM